MTCWAVQVPRHSPPLLLKVLNGSHLVCNVPLQLSLTLGGTLQAVHATTEWMTQRIGKSMGLNLGNMGRVHDVHVK